MEQLAIASTNTLKLQRVRVFIPDLEDAVGSTSGRIPTIGNPWTRGERRELRCEMREWPPCYQAIHPSMPASDWACQAGPGLAG